MRFSKWHAFGNSYLLVERADAAGPRIAAAWLAARSGLDAVTIVVGDREVAARIGAGSIETDVGVAELGEIETLALNEEHVEFTPVSVGNPHAVIRGDPA